MNAIKEMSAKVPWPASQGLSIVWVSRHPLDLSQIDLLHRMHGRDIQVTQKDIYFLGAGHFFDQLRHFHEDGQLPYVVIKLNWIWPAFCQDIDVGWFDRDNNNPGMIYKAQSIHCYINSVHYRIDRNK